MFLCLFIIADSKSNGTCVPTFGTGRIQWNWQTTVDSWKPNVEIIGFIKSVFLIFNSVSEINWIFFFFFFQESFGLLNSFFVLCNSTYLVWAPLLGTLGIWQWPESILFRWFGAEWLPGTGCKLVCSHAKKYEASIYYKCFWENIYIYI